MKLTSYSIRNGCRYYDDCCCDPNSGHSIDIACCCELYSFSLQGSNDNSTWKTLHKVEKDASFRFCQVRTYDLPQTENFRFIRFKIDEEKPNCPKCLQINQIELYGELLNSYDSFESENNEESVSIIGKVKHF